MRGCVNARAAFTLTEVIVVVAILAALAAVFLPKLSRAEGRSAGLACANNLKRLQTGWLMYSTDNTDKLPLNGGLGSVVVDAALPEAQEGGSKSSWVQGRVDRQPSAANTALIRVGLLYRYVNDLAVYKCPADVPGVRGFPTVRSVSMNCWMNPIESWNISGGNYPALIREFRKQADILAHGPAMAWVFIDENPWGIDDGYFVCDPSKPIWINVPASWHEGAGGLSFADGHVELKRWRDSHVLNCISSPSGGGLMPEAGVGDLKWLQERSSSKN
jgi:prepilin-type N-terminal cleavage/methylation domain-containing protein/prepilin-type processing-associated H-X9-DG protein